MEDFSRELIVGKILVIFAIPQFLQNKKKTILKKIWKKKILIKLFLQSAFS